MLVSAKNKGDRTILTHMEDNREMFAANKEFRQINDGWTEERSMKRIASIPPLLLAKVGHKIAPRGVLDRKALKKWLQTEEGAPCVVDDDKPKAGSGLIIVK